MWRDAARLCGYVLLTRQPGVRSCRSQVKFGVTAQNWTRLHGKYAAHCHEHQALNRFERAVGPPSLLSTVTPRSRSVVPHPTSCTRPQHSSNSRLRHIFCTRIACAARCSLATPRCIRATHQQQQLHRAVVLLLARATNVWPWCSCAQCPGATHQRAGVGRCSKQQGTGSVAAGLRRAAANMARARPWTSTPPTTRPHQPLGAMAAAVRVDTGRGTMPAARRPRRP
jgi:hypothetical protein